MRSAIVAIAAKRASSPTPPDGTSSCSPSVRKHSRQSQNEGAPAPSHVRPIATRARVVFRPARDLGHERRLSDAGLARHEHEPRSPVLRVGDGAFEDAKLLAATDERPHDGAILLAGAGALR
jgi:hypothetical protein